VKIKVERPDCGGAADIFAKYLTPDIPFASPRLRAATLPVPSAP